MFPAEFNNDLHITKRKRNEPIVEEKPIYKISVVWLFDCVNSGIYYKIIIHNAVSLRETIMQINVCGTVAAVKCHLKLTLLPHSVDAHEWVSNALGGESADKRVRHEMARPDNTFWSLIPICHLWESWSSLSPMFFRHHGPLTLYELVSRSAETNASGKTPAGGVKCCVLFKTNTLSDSFFTQTWILCHPYDIKIQHL